jgi:hypothetical protein
VSQRNIEVRFNQEDWKIDDGQLADAKARLVSDFPSNRKDEGLLLVLYNCKGVMKGASQAHRQERFTVLLIPTSSGQTSFRASPPQSTTQSVV